MNDVRLSLLHSRRTDLEALCSALQQYRHGHSALISWIEETTERQENTRPGQTDSKALSEQLAQQTVRYPGTPPCPGRWKNRYTTYSI